jgi:hypothetical protein
MENVSIHRYICSGQLVYFVVIWFILLSFGTFPPFWYFVAKKNLANLVQSVHFPQVYGPCILLVVISWVSFWLNREATSDRISLGSPHFIVFLLPSMYLCWFDPHYIVFYCHLCWFNATYRVKQSSYTDLALYFKLGAIYTRYWPGWVAPTPQVLLPPFLTLKIELHNVFGSLSSLHQKCRSTF